MTPQNPTFKQPLIHTYPQFPAKSKGSMTGIMLSVSTLRCELARSANILFTHPAAALTETWTNAFHTSYGCHYLLCDFPQKQWALSGICNAENHAVKPRKRPQARTNIKGKSPAPHPWDLSTQTPVCPDSLENFSCCIGSLWNPSLH